MKKLFTLLSLFVVIGMSANVMGQDATQYQGEVHSFSVTDNSAGGFSYEWKVYSDAGLTTEVSSGYTLTNETTAKVTLEWTTISEGTYYVGVAEKNGTNGCATSRYVQVEIAAANYDLIVSAVNAGGEAVTKLDDCMSGAGQILSNSQTLNTAGVNERYFKLALTNDGTTPWTKGSWSFDYTLTGEDGNSTETVSTVEVVGSPSGVTGVGAGASSDAKTVNVSNVGEFIIKVTTKDNPGNSTDYDVSLPFAVSNLKVGVGAVAEKAGNDGNNSETYTLRTYPTTSTITIE